jgi:hypothetical protein
MISKDELVSSISVLRITRVYVCSMEGCLHLVIGFLPLTIGSPEVGNLLV